MRRMAALIIFVTLVVYAGMRDINAWRAAEPQPALPRTPFVIDTARGPVRFTVELATTKAQQERGLMFRKSLAPDAGMLFNMRTERPVAFWMKDTLIPLDMLFFDRDGVIVRIVPNAKPLSLEPIGTRKPVRAVLEIGGGRAKEMGLELGDISEDAIFVHAQH